MSSAALHSYLLPLLLALVSCAPSRPGLKMDPQSATAASSGPWLQYADVRQAGFDGQALRAVCERADSLRSAALMAVFRGHVILACGDVKRQFEAALGAEEPGQRPLRHGRRPGRNRPGRHSRRLRH